MDIYPQDLTLENRSYPYRLPTTGSSFLYADKDTDFHDKGLPNRNRKSALERFDNESGSTSLMQVAILVSYDDFLIHYSYTVFLGNALLIDDTIGFTPSWRFVIGNETREFQFFPSFCSP